MPVGNRIRAKSGQAMAELVIALVTIVIIIVGTTTLSHITLSQIRLRRDVRAEAGEAALKRSTVGWVDLNDSSNDSNSGSALAHRINSFNRLETFPMELSSQLPASNYTLSARNLANGELGLRTTRIQERIPLDSAFLSFIYNKPDASDSATLLLQEEAVFPATIGLWPDSETEDDP